MQQSVRKSIKRDSKLPENQRISKLLKLKVNNSADEVKDVLNLKEINFWKPTRLTNK